MVLMQYFTIRQRPVALDEWIVLLIELFVYLNKSLKSQYIRQILKPITLK